MMNYDTNTNQGICPPGFHVPDFVTEWQPMVDYLGGYLFAGGKMKETGFAHWNSPNTSATNESGFTALGSGLYSTVVNFSYLKGVAMYWSSTDNGATSYSSRLDSSTGLFNNNVTFVNSNKIYGFSVRCIKD
jgi:uncharacterized protein (TIGR02145 family)